jgi:hypothetical protein
LRTNTALKIVDLQKLKSNTRHVACIENRTIEDLLMKGENTTIQELYWSTVEYRREKHEEYVLKWREVRDDLEARIRS